MSVNSVNWSDYSASEIIKMHKSGEEVPKDVLQKAQKETGYGISTDSDDTTSYKIVDSSDTYNGSQKTRASLEEQGLSKKEIAETMTDLCKEKSSEIAEMLGGIEEAVQKAMSGGIKSEDDMAALTSQLESGINAAGDAIELAAETADAGKNALKSSFFKGIKVYREAVSTAKKTEALANSLKEQAEEAATLNKIEVVKSEEVDAEKEKPEEQK